MKLAVGKYLQNISEFNGQEADLIKIESPSDFDELEENICKTDYYGQKYFENNLGYQDRELKLENLPFAAILDFFRPNSLLELGCGKGDLLFYLKLVSQSQVTGIDISSAVKEKAFQEVKDSLYVGDLLDVGKKLSKDQKTFDTICAFDIWEHLNPARLNNYISCLFELATKDCLFFFCLPAFGQDEVFGEVFPLEFEENRPEMEKNQPFQWLVAEKTDPPIPVNGHLIWASSKWWESRFTEKGLIRQKEMERAVHRILDPYLRSAQQAFYIFSFDTSEAKNRLAPLLADPINYMWAWRSFLKFKRGLEDYEQQLGRSILEMSTLDRILDDAVFRLLADQEKEICYLRDMVNRPPWFVRGLKKLIS